MGQWILDRVLALLEQGGIPAEAAFPGQKAPHILRPVAAVHISQADYAACRITVEVTLLSPASLGGDRCQREAARAAEILKQNGAQCVQKGCSYDSVSRVFSVSVLAAFAGTAEELGPGFQVYLDDVLCPYVQAVSAEESRKCRGEYAMGKAQPIGITGGSLLWSIRLEELLPLDAPEPEAPEGEFRLRIQGPRKTEQYLGCRWTQILREFTGQGLRQVRAGMAMGREESINEQAAV